MIYIIDEINAYKQLTTFKYAQVTASNINNSFHKQSMNTMISCNRREQKQEQYYASSIAYLAWPDKNERENSLGHFPFLHAKGKSFRVSPIQEKTGKRCWLFKLSEKTETVTWKFMSPD